MTELELLRRAFDTVPDPDDGAVLAARAGLLAEIESFGTSSVRRRPKRGLRLLAAVAVGLAGLLAGILVLALPRGGGLTGTEIAAAAARALTPPPGVILHDVERFTWAPVGGTDPHPVITERWVAGGRPWVIHERSERGESESGECGEISYDRPTNLLSAWSLPDRPQVRQGLQSRSDPAGEYLSAYRSGNVRYRGKTTFRGVPAYTLVVSFPSYPLVVTYVVRRDNYYPLRTVRRTKTHVGVTTYSDFERIPRNAGTEHLLHVRPHPEAFLLGPGRFYRPRAACAGFGSYESLTGKGKKP